MLPGVRRLSKLREGPGLVLPVVREAGPSPAGALRWRRASSCLHSRKHHVPDGDAIIVLAIPGLVQEDVVHLPVAGEIHRPRLPRPALRARPHHLGAVLRELDQHVGVAVTRGVERDGPPGGDARRLHRGPRRRPPAVRAAAAKGHAAETQQGEQNAENRAGLPLLFF